MRRVVLLAFLSLALPIAAFADSITFNDAGTLGGTTPTAVSTGTISGGGDYSVTIPLVQFTDNNGTTTNTVSSGSVVFDTGTLTSTGSGTYTFTGTVTVENASSATLFTSSVTNGTIQVTGSGANQVIAINGGLPGGIFQGGIGVKVISSGSRLITGSGNSVSSSGSGDPVVPEPGTLGLLGTGLIGIAGLVRRKIRMS